MCLPGLACPVQPGTLLVSYPVSQGRQCPGPLWPLSCQPTAPAAGLRAAAPHPRCPCTETQSTIQNGAGLVVYKLSIYIPLPSQDLILTY